MDVHSYISRIRNDLIAAAALGDEKTQATAEALATAAESSTRLALLSALSDLAGEISSQLDDRTVHVSLDGDDVTVDIRKNSGGDGDKPGFDHLGFDEMTGDISRVTLRLVEQLKSRAEEAAAQSGQSLNSWMAGVVSGALRDQMRGYGYPRREDSDSDF